MALALGTGTSRSGVAGLSSCRETAEQAAGALGHSQAAQPGPPHSSVFYWVFFEHRTPHAAGSRHCRPEGSTLAAVGV